MTNDDQPLDSLPLPVAAAALDIAGADEVDGIAEDVDIVVFSTEGSQLQSGRGRASVDIVGILDIGQRWGQRGQMMDK